MPRHLWREIAQLIELEDNEDEKQPHRMDTVEELPPPIQQPNTAELPVPRVHDEPLG